MTACTGMTLYAAAALLCGGVASVLLWAAHVQTVNLLRAELAAVRGVLAAVQHDGRGGARTCGASSPQTASAWVGKHRI